MARLFSKREDIVDCFGEATSRWRPEHDLDEDSGAKKLCDAYDQSQAHSEIPSVIRPTDSAYGCNMVVRYSTARKVRFDETLPLYAWLEDRDYSHRVTKTSACTG